MNTSGTHTPRYIHVKFWGTREEEAREALGRISLLVLPQANRCT